MRATKSTVAGLGKHRASTCGCGAELETCVGLLTSRRRGVRRGRRRRLVDRRAFDRAGRVADDEHALVNRTQQVSWPTASRPRCRRAKCGPTHRDGRDPRSSSADGPSTIQDVLVVRVGAIATRGRTSWPTRDVVVDADVGQQIGLFVEAPSLPGKLVFDFRLHRGRVAPQREIGQADERQRNARSSSTP